MKNRLTKLYYSLHGLISPSVSNLNVEQKKLDLYRAALLLSYHKKCELNKESILNNEDTEKTYNEIENMDYGEILTFVNRSINFQIKDMFEKLFNFEKSVFKLPEGNQLKFKIEDYFLAMNNSDAYRPSFSLFLDESTEKSANEGVFVRGKISPGTVLAIFPGYVHLPEYVSKPKFLSSLLPDDDLMLMARPDNCLIDSRAIDKAPFNPFALAHKVNHVPAGKKTNVLQVSYDIPAESNNRNNDNDAFPLHLRKYIPNVYKNPPTYLGTPDRTMFMHSMVLLSTCPIQDGTELFMDYRLNPNLSHLPSWYIPYNKEEAYRRWNSSSNTKENNKNMINSMLDYFKKK